MRDLHDLPWLQTLNCNPKCTYCCCRKFLLCICLRSILWWPMRGSKEDPQWLWGWCANRCDTQRRTRCVCYSSHGPWSLRVCLSAESKLLPSLHSEGLQALFRIYFTALSFSSHCLVCLWVLGWNFDLTLYQAVPWNCGRFWSDSFWKWAISTENLFAFGQLSNCSLELCWSSLLPDSHGSRLFFGTALSNLWFTLMKSNCSIGTG